ncbi:acetyltransferase [Oceaniserpentilla sp. 4NH20-0058]
MIGGGGHSAVLADILLKQQREIIAVISLGDISNRAVFSGITKLSSDEEIKQFDSTRVKLVNGIGMMPRSKLKQQVNETYIALGYEFETVISNEAVVSKYADVGVGTQIFPGAIVQPGVVIGPHSIVNTGAVIEHDCRIGAYNHIAPRATLCGQVQLQDNVYVGAGATIIQRIRLAQGCVVGAGSTILKNVARNTLVYTAGPNKSKLVEYDK